MIRTPPPARPRMLPKKSRQLRPDTLPPIPRPAPLDGVPIHPDDDPLGRTRPETGPTSHFDQLVDFPHSPPLKY